MQVRGSPTDTIASLRELLVLRLFGGKAVQKGDDVSPTELSSSEAERLRAFERQGHDALAESYHEFFSALTAIATSPLLDAVRLQAGTSLLDVASGPGALTAEAANRGARTVGVDLSPRMVELAQRLHPTTEYREADVEHLPFPDHIFDAVVCAFGLGHFPRPELALAECVRTLSPGGRIAFSWWDDPSRQRVQGIFREAIAEIGVSAPVEVPQGHNVFRFSDSAEFLRLLDGAGLTEVKVVEHAATYVVPDTETLWHGGLGSLVLTGAVIRMQDQKTQKLIRTAFERRASVYRSADGLNLPIAFKIGSGQRPN
ncbi:class I SAM-dependent methyltransferase [Bradyrhizobium sp. WYCCWR 13023]|uniref:Class I SAM-dependent methyltransferase n=1 Tax=Bradyrhizobium zhengyangense TaxID=2911009 RepID=A0A9X1RBH5_9BRAD|nr:class I SAM-dependent methyltransferase [Bradyrhizobium zhengyangense]MCG2631057.1 class I SAM-dependent methyltransferase [Bradyrhizobium zhengyangense]